MFGADQKILMFENQHSNEVDLVQFRALGFTGFNLN